MEKPVVFNFSSVEAAIGQLSLRIEIDQTFIEILKYMKIYHQAKSIIIENEYIDKDFSNELSNLYSKTFRCREGYCKRLHFFKEAFDNYEDFVHKLHDNQFTYLGFLVKRPVEVGKVGRTLIEPNNFENFFYLCQIKREVHLLGKTITAHGVPFIEQDAMVMTCAQASIWVIAKYMHYAHLHNRYLPFDITDKATSGFGYTGRTIPSSGLTISQIITAFNNMGFFPILYSKPREKDYDGNYETYKRDLSMWNPTEKIYQYVESEIPCLISFDNHAVTAIGHKLIDSRQESKSRQITTCLEKTKKYFQKKDADVQFAFKSSSIFVDAFIIHDDQAGPYKLLPTCPDTFKSLKDKHSALLPKEKEAEFTYKDVESSVDSIIIPLPDKIYLLGEDLDRNISKLFSSDDGEIKIIDILINQADKKNNIYAKELASSTLASEQNPIIFRKYFIKSSEFKSRCQASKNLSEAVKNYYLEMNMPRFMWIIEISTYYIYKHTKLILGEIIVDSTGNKYDFQGALLSIHLPGYFYKNRGISDDQFVDEKIPLEEPYELRIRSGMGEYCAF